MKPTDPSTSRDDYFGIPFRVTEAAGIVDTWFKSQGIETWELMGICSRNHARQPEMDLKSDLKSLLDQAEHLHRTAQYRNLGWSCYMANVVEYARESLNSEKRRI